MGIWMGSLGGGERGAERTVVVCGMMSASPPARRMDDVQRVCGLGPRRSETHVEKRSASASGVEFRNLKERTQRSRGLAV